MKPNPVPAGLTTLTAQLDVDGAAKAIDFYVKAFGAVEVMRAPDPSGQKIWHAELKIGNAAFFVNDVFREMGGEPTRSGYWLYFDDCDAAFARAIAAGAEQTMPMSDMFWGDRIGQVRDPFGIKWTIATHVKDMTQDEMMKAQAAFIASMKR
ncbi:MAG: VOC family protein [Polyangiales bacterium]